MSTLPTPATQPGPIYSLLPAVFRSRDLAQGGPLEALFAVLESQAALVRQNVWQLYDDHFIETCAPWAIPYIGELIGFDPVYTVALTGPDSRAEVANIIGYRRRKGTLLAMEQLTRDVSGRTTFAVEEFKRLITTLSLRDVRPHHADTASLRRGRALQGIDGPGTGPFARLNLTIDVRRIAPRTRVAPPAPDPTPLDITLHGPGNANIPDVALWMFRWHSRLIPDAPACSLGSGGWLFSASGGPVPLFQQPPAAPIPFARLLDEADAPAPITRWALAHDTARYYPSSICLTADGVQVPVDQIVSANLTEINGRLCTVPAGKIAIDPELGRIQYAADLTPPAVLRVHYSYGSAAEIGGGPYDRSANLTPPAQPVFTALVGTADYPTLADAVAAWNVLPAGSSAVIVLPNYEAFDVDLTGPGAIQVPAQSQLLIAAAEVSTLGAPPEWQHAAVTLRGSIEIAGLPAPALPDGDAAPMGQVQLSGLWLAADLRLTGSAACVQLADCTLVPGLARTPQGEPAHPGEPSIHGNAVGSSLCLTRVVTGPVALPSSCSVRIAGSILDAGSPWCPAFAGADLASPGPALQIEDSTVFGRVWAQLVRLASNTIFWARYGKHDPWKAPVWASRRQSGCVRFCWLPAVSLVPRTYQCIPPDAASEFALLPRFVSTTFGQPGYALLAGNVPLALWRGADNGSQIGVFQQIQETEAVANILIRSEEYLPVNLERGVFLIPSAPCGEPEPPPEPYAQVRLRRCAGAADDIDNPPGGIGIGLL